MVESDISKRDKYLDNERQKYLIKSQIYGIYYCSKLLENNLPDDINEKLSTVYITLLKDKLIESDLDQVFDLINGISVSNLSFENRILMRQLGQFLMIPEEDEFIYYDEIESIIDPFIDLKLKIYNYFKKSKFSKALELVNIILKEKKLLNYEKFLFLGYKIKILAEIQDFKSADLMVDQALDCYELLSVKEKQELWLKNEELDKYKLNNLQKINIEDFQIIRISTLYLIKSFYLRENGQISNILLLLETIIPFYLQSNCKLSYADLINEKANVEYENGKAKDGLNHYKIAFKIYLLTKDQQRKQAIFNNISRIFIDLKDWDSALRFIEKGLQLHGYDNFNESLLISKCVLLYKTNRLVLSLDLIKEFIFNDKLYNSQNPNTLYNLNIGLILFLILSLENGNFNSLDIFKERINILLNNDLSFRSKWKDLNQFILNIIDSPSRNENIISNLSNIKNQLKISNQLIILRELV